MAEDINKELELDTILVTNTMETISSTFDNFLSAATVDSVYGKPIKSGDTTIIPTAEVLSALGFGMGGGGGTGPAMMNTEETEAEEGETDVTMSGGSGVGGGGGGRVLSRPVAVVIASPDGVRVEPVVDVTKLGLALFTAMGFMIGMLARMRR